MVKKSLETMKEGKRGKESKLDFWGESFLTLSLIAVAGFTISGLSNQQSTFYFLAAALFINGFFVFHILTSFGEIIRLLKRLNHLPYNGEISQSHQNKAVLYKCTQCEKIVAPDDLICFHCGEKLT